MHKMALVSILVASIALPYRAAKDPSAVRGLRRALVWFAVFDLCYLVTVVYVLPRLS